MACCLAKHQAFWFIPPHNSEVVVVIQICSVFCIQGDSKLQYKNEEVVGGDYLE
jgi:hypothetical protein